MSGLLSKFKKGGGGFLNQVDGVIAGFTFTTEPEFGGNASSGAPKGDGTPLWVALTAQVDGAEKPETTHLFAGYNADDFVISEDGSSLTPAVDGASLWGGTAFAQFYESAVTNGLTDVEPTEDGTMNFGGLIGARAFRSGQGRRRHEACGQEFPHVEGQGQRAGPEEGQGREVLRHPHPSGREGLFGGQCGWSAEREEGGSREDLLPSLLPLRKKPVAKSAPAEDVTDAATIALTEILAKNADGLPKTKLNLAVTRHLVAHPQREAIRTFLADDANLDTLAEAGVITYDDGVLACRLRMREAAFAKQVEALTPALSH
jgi:hypothetical protein